MQVNWSLILNILLLVAVIAAIVRTLRARRPLARSVPKQPSIGLGDTVPDHDDIIAIRKLDNNLSSDQAQPKVIKPGMSPSSTPSPHRHAQPLIREHSEQLQSKGPTAPVAPSVMMFLLAKDCRQLAGYELLQTLLAAGLRFGDGQLFHRHQSRNGQGPVLFSLAAATAAGTFDMQNIGACMLRGLCLFMHASGNPTIDSERFEVMLETAKQLAEGLDTYLLDEQRQPLSDASIERYQRLLCLDELVEL